MIYLERLWDLLKALTFHLQKYPTMLLNKYICSGVSRISFRGGGIQNIFGKAGVFAWREAPCSAWQSHVFSIGWFGGMLPRKKNLKWCNLVRFGEHFAKFCKKKNCKDIHFFIKIINNVLLRTLYLGVLEHTPQISCQLCNLVCFRAHYYIITLLPPQKN